MSASPAAPIVASQAANKNASLDIETNSRPSSRKRNTVVVEKRVSTEMVADRSVNGVADDKMLSNEKDLRHTIRGESVVERSRDLSHIKKRLIPSSAISPRRKKTTPKPEKPKWQTVLSILTKNCLLLAALLWLGQTAWRWTYKIGDNGNSPFVALEYEGRISEIEASLKKTTKMLQVQLDVVDRKIGSEIGLVTKELSKQVEEKKLQFDNELKKLETKTDLLYNSLSELKQMDLVSREEFEKRWNELENSNNLDNSYSNLDLDQVRILARDIVEKEIEKHAADGLGLVDYALASGGARVVGHSEPFSYGKANGWFTSKNQNGVHANARKMLEPSFGEPGQCFALQGSSGFVEIRLRTGIIPEAVTLEHVSKSVAYDRSSAPKDCRVSAWFESSNEDSAAHAQKMVALTEFSYDLDKSNAQTFNVEATDSGIVNRVRFDFMSNHGNSALTCIYRLRVHGYEPSSLSAAVSSQA